MSKCCSCKLGKTNNHKRCDISKVYGCSDRWVTKVSDMKDVQVLAIYLKMQRDGVLTA
jgi:hypothetical protein